MKEDEIVERGLIAFSIFYFSAEVMTRITLAEQERAKEKEMMKAGLYITVKEV